MKRFCLVILLVACFFVTGCDNKPETKDSEYPSINFWERQYQDGNTLWFVCYGTSSNELSFVFFEKGSIDPPNIPGIRRIVSREISHQVGTKTIIDKCEGWLIVDNYSTKMIQLPTEKQLYEIKDGKLVSSDERVTLDQMKDYIESQPSDYSIESLLSYVKNNTDND